MFLDSPNDRERLRVTMQPGTPFVWVDRSELEQVLSRVIHNALALAEEQKPISLSAGMVDEDPDMVRVSVQAPGMNVDEEDLSPVFGPSAAVLSERPSSGRALGLAVARALVELHGGRIWLDDTEGTGAAINFTLPKYTAKDAPPEVIVSDENSGEGAEAYGEGESDDSGRRSVRAETGARQPEPLR